MSFLALIFIILSASNPSTDSIVNVSSTISFPSIEITLQSATFLLNCLFLGLIGVIYLFKQSDRITPSLPDESVAPQDVLPLPLLRKIFEYVPEPQGILPVPLLRKIFEYVPRSRIHVIQLNLCGVYNLKAYNLILPKRPTGEVYRLTRPGDFFTDILHKEVLQLTRTDVHNISVCYFAGEACIMAYQSLNKVVKQYLENLPPSSELPFQLFYVKQKDPTTHRISAGIFLDRVAITQVATSPTRLGKMPISTRLRLPTKKLWYEIAVGMMDFDFTMRGTRYPNRIIPPSEFRLSLSQYHALRLRLARAAINTNEGLLSTVANPCLDQPFYFTHFRQQNRSDFTPLVDFHSSLILEDPVAEPSNERLIEFWRNLAVLSTRVTTNARQSSQVLPSSSSTSSPSVSYPNSTSTSGANHRL